MNRTIKTYDDLRAEIVKTQNLLAAQREQVMTNWHELKQEFNPLSNVFGVVGKMVSPDKSNPLINTGLRIASDLFIKGFVLSKAGWLTRLAVPFVMKNFSSHMIADKGTNFINKLSSIFKRNRNGTSA